MDDSWRMATATFLPIFGPVWVPHLRETIESAVDWGFLANRGKSTRPTHVVNYPQSAGMWANHGLCPGWMGTK